MLRQILLNGLVESSLIALVALGFALTYTTIRIFHLAHAAAYVIGAYGCLFALTRLGLGLAPSVIIGIVLAAGFGAFIEWVVYAPLARRQSGPLVGLLSSLGTYIVLVNLIAMMFGAENQTLLPGQSTAVALPGGLVLSRTQIAQIVLSFSVAALAVVLVDFTALGRMMRVVRDNSALAAITGTNVYLVRIGVVAFGSALAGFAGVLSAIDVGTDPNAGLPVMMIASVAMILGGSRSTAGPIIGAVMVGLARSLVVWTISAQWADAITFGVMIVILVASPPALLVRRTRIEEAAA